MSDPKPKPDEGQAVQGLVEGIMRALEQYNRETGLVPDQPARRRKRRPKRTTAPKP